ncbi:MAG: leucine-rich repeat domain-containing protein [Anaerolineales bacterium]|nr:leucine-rich repeat domain-containing protein [Anaerolineales bacterium]
MKGLRTRWFNCLHLVLAVACAELPADEEVTRGVVVVETAVPQEGTPVVLQDLFLRATEEVVTEVVEVTPEAVPGTPAPPELESKELIVCQAAEPDSLFLYSSYMLDKENLHHAIYENLVTQLNYGYQAQGIEKLPSLADGDAVLQTVTVQAGDTVLSADGEVVTLVEGVDVLNAAGERVIFDGTPLQMGQLVVDFTLKPMVWSDGMPVSAADSVFSFEVNRTVEMPFTTADTFRTARTFRTDRTASYQATSDLSLRWTGLPGWLDQTYFRNVWTPLPQHQLAHHEMAELANLFGPNSDTSILSSGPFAVKEWVPGDNILLQANPYYYRHSEELPRLTQIEVKFIPDTNSAVAQLISGACDILTRDVVDASQLPFLLEAESADVITTYTQANPIFEHIAFGINSYGGYGDDNGRPDWFEDVRVRQAIAHCTDRQRMVDEILFGLSEVMHTYVPSVNPLYPEDIPQWSYDVAAANVLLDEAGYRDTDGDGIREDPATGTPFHVELGTTADNEMRQHLTEIFKENLLECGIDVELFYLPASEWFADGPEGKLFGRQYDLAEYAWLTEMEPPCGYWLSENISGPVAEGFAGWDGVNHTGWRNDEFDAAYRQAQRAFRSSQEYVTAHQAAMRLFAEQLPTLPLFPRLQVAATAPYVRNFGLNPTQPSELWNIEELDITLTEDEMMRATIPPAEFCAGITEGSSIECQALVALYQQMGSRDWYLYSDWLTSPTPCSWSHIVCAGNRVIELEIYSSGSGTLPPQLGDFAYLQNLQLSWQGFSTLPPEIGNLTNLRRLTLSSGNLPTLPPEIGKLTNLRHLALTGNNLTALPPEFYNLVNLTTLDLSGNKLSNFSPEMANLVNLKTLDLSNNRLSSVPPEIFTLANLTELDLQENVIVTLNSEIGNLTNLEKLDLYWNGLRDLPVELWNLTHLTELGLSSNNLSYIAPEIGNLTNLNTLWLSYNNLASLPPEIWNLTSLQYLYLRDNQISTLPAEIGNLTNLYWLILAENNLNEIPPEIGNLTTLNHLDLAKNNLRTLPQEIGNLTSLSFLSLYQNNLNSLPAEIGNLVNLYSLDLGQNNLTSLPLEIGNLRYLRWLDLPNNPLEVLPAELCAALPENISVHPSSLCNP